MKVVRYFASFEDAFSATALELSEAGIENELAEKWIEFRGQINLQNEWNKLQSEGINLLTQADVGYPNLLREIEKSPVLLYYKGSMIDGDELCIAAVGTRKITNYGRTVTPYLIKPLIEAGAVIVSGLAYGVDSMVQKMAMDSGRRTIAVLGCGLDEHSLYPKEHAYLAQQITDSGGALLSEYPPGTPPLKHHFIARNRIISGMSVATIIVECNLKSGSLITARYALEQNRTVYAVPGPIYAETSQGPNNLIKMGAKLVTSASDILDDLNLEYLPEQQQAQAMFGDSPAESAILQLLNFEPTHINELVKQSSLEAAEVTSALTFLEMKGKVRNLGGQQYILAR